MTNASSQTPNERHQVFLLKKRIVDAVLAEARIDENCEIYVKFRTDFSTMRGQCKKLINYPIRISQIVDIL